MSQTRTILFDLHCRTVPWRTQAQYTQSEASAKISLDDQRGFIESHKAFLRNTTAFRDFELFWTSTFRPRTFIVIPLANLPDHVIFLIADDLPQSLLLCESFPQDCKSEFAKSCEFWEDQARKEDSPSPLNIGEETIRVMQDWRERKLYSKFKQSSRYKNTWKCHMYTNSIHHSLRMFCPLALIHIPRIQQNMSI